MIMQVHQVHLYASIAFMFIVQLIITSRGNTILHWLAGTTAGLIVFKILLAFLPQIWPI